MVSVICVVCGSYGGRMVRKSPLDKCPGTPPLGRRLALRGVLLGFLLGSKRAARLDSIPGVILGAQTGPCRTRGPSLAFLSSSLLSKQRCVMF